MKPLMTLNSMELMLPNEVHLAALNEGAQLGLFCVDIESMNGQYSNEGLSDVQQAHRDVLWKLALSKLHNAIPLPFDKFVNPDSDPFASRVTLASIVILLTVSVMNVKCI
jgi:hypothetical protein